MWSPLILWSFFGSKWVCLVYLDPTFQEEQEYMELVAAEKHQQEALKSALAKNKTLSILEEILEDVRKAADRLEEEIEEHAFDNNKQVCCWTLTAHFGETSQHHLSLHSEPKVMLAFFSV